MPRTTMQALSAAIALAFTAMAGRAQTDSVKKDTASLPSVAIIAKRNLTSTNREGFYDRKKLGLGTFFDSTDVRQFDGSGLAERLRGVGGVRIVSFHEKNEQNLTPELRAASSIHQGMNGEPCWSSVVYDNVTIYRSGSFGRPPNLRTDLGITGLEAIEFYRGHMQAPQMVSAMADCGILVLWSRRKH